MARKRKKAQINAGELNLTAMIDVAFQLLAFFIITVHPVDVVANLNVFRPSPEATTPANPTTPSMLRITVFPEGFSINDKAVDKRQLEGLLRKLADIDTKQTVLIMCTLQSPHERLVELLDMCAKYKLTNLSVVTSNAY